MAAASLVIQHIFFSFLFFLYSTFSIVVALGLSCPTAGGIFLGLGIELMSPVLAGSFLTTGPPGKSDTNLIWLKTSVSL